MRKILLLSFLLLSISLFAQGTWVNQTSGVTVALQSVSAVDANVCWVGGSTGTVLRTTDGGTTWTNVGGGALGTANDVYTIWAFDADNALASTSTGTAPTSTFVFKTTNGGTLWTQVFTQTGGGFMDAIKMKSATEGFMYGDPVGARWSLWKTTDAGATWDSTNLRLAQVGTEAGWNNAMHLDGNNIWFGTNNTKLYYSSDNGLNWTPQPTTGTVNTYAVWFNTPTNGMCGATAMLKTTNSGLNWAAATLPGTGSVSGITGYADIYYTIRQNIYIYYTSNSGTSWSTAYTNTGGGNFYHLTKARNGADAVWGVTSTGKILKGSNLGLPVELTSFTATANRGVVTLNWSTSTEINNKGFEIQRKSEGSDFSTVSFVNGNGSSTEVHNYSFVEKALAGTYTYRLRQIDYNGNSEYSNAVEVVVNPDQYALDQNYPNPFNPSTRINFTLAQSGLVKLTVYNLLGQQVETLVNEVREAGTHNISFNASNLTSGVYFYKLETPSFSKTMKMLLSK